MSQILKFILENSEFGRQICLIFFNFYCAKVFNFVLRDPENFKDNIEKCSRLKVLSDRD